MYMMIGEHSALVRMMHIHTCSKIPYILDNNEHKKDTFGEPLLHYFMSSSLIFKSLMPGEDGIKVEETKPAEHEVHS